MSTQYTTEDNIDFTEEERQQMLAYLKEEIELGSVFTAMAFEGVTGIIPLRLYLSHRLRERYPLVKKFFGEASQK